MEGKDRTQGENADGNFHQRTEVPVRLYAAYAKAARDPLFLEEMESTIASYETATADGL
jgi:hypothetical protein